MRQIHEVPASIAQGFGLIQLLLVALILAGLLLWSVESVIHLYHRAASEGYMQELMHTVKSGRIHAIQYRTPVTLCHLSAQKVCDRNWHLGMQLFSDQNGNKQQDEGEDILYRLMPVSSSAHLVYNRRYIHFSITGSTLGSNGHFIYCPIYGLERNRQHDQLARIIVINRQGRARLAGDDDRDGIADHNGKNAVCAD